MITTQGLESWTMTHSLWGMDEMVPVQYQTDQVHLWINYLWLRKCLPRHFRNFYHCPLFQFSRLNRASISDLSVSVGDNASICVSPENFSCNLNSSSLHLPSLFFLALENNVDIVPSFARLNDRSAPPTVTWKSDNYPFLPLMITNDRFSLTCIGILIIFTCLNTVWELVLWWYFRKWYIYYSSARYQSNKNVEITEMFFLITSGICILFKWFRKSSSIRHPRTTISTWTCSKWIQQNWISLLKQVTSILVTDVSDIGDNSGHAFYV